MTWGHRSQSLSEEIGGAKAGDQLGLTRPADEVDHLLLQLRPVFGDQVELVPLPRHKQSKVE
jgi:hypothetical protein